MMNIAHPLPEYSPAEQLIQHWKRSATARTRAAASRQDIAAFEQTYHSVLPDDFRAYFEYADGFNQDEGYQDEEGFNFWPLNKLCRAAEYDAGKYRSSTGKSYFLFCDYLDFSWGYAISLENSSIVMVGAADGVLAPVADSFREFVRMYVRDDAELYPQHVKEV